MSAYLRFLTQNTYIWIQACKRMYTYPQEVIWLLYHTQVVIIKKKYHPALSIYVCVCAHKICQRACFLFVQSKFLFREIIKQPKPQSNLQLAVIFRKLVLLSLNKTDHKTNITIESIGVSVNTQVTIFFQSKKKEHFDFRLFFSFYL